MNMYMYVYGGDGCDVGVPVMATVRLLVSHCACLRLAERSRRCSWRRVLAGMLVCVSWDVGVC